MTSRVTVDPVAHKIEVVESGEGTPTTTVLEKNSAPRDFWIYGKRELTVREVPDEG